MLVDERDGPRRLWAVVFWSRHVVIVALAVAAVVLREFGENRIWITVAILVGVLPYDVGVHVYARRRGSLPPSMPIVYAPLPAAFVLAFPATWVPALLAALGNLTLFSVTFDTGLAAVSMVISAAAFAVAGLAVEPDAAVTGWVGFAFVSPAVVLGVGALFRAHREAGERYDDLLQGATDMVYSHDVDTLTFTSANEAALRATGYSREELERITVADVVAPAHLEEAYDRIQRAIRAGPDAQAVPWELEIVTKDGRLVPVEVSARVIYRKGEAAEIHGIARDISERRQIEAQRAALDAAKTEFIANAAHELRTPLTTLAGLARVLREKLDSMAPDELEEALDALSRQGQRARKLADQLLDLSSLDLGRLDLTAEPVCLCDTVHHALEAAPPPNGTTVELSVPDGLTVLADPVRLQAVVGNLLTNAYRYGGPHVVVEAAGHDRVALLSVVDDGPGVDPDLVPHLFEPFTRGDHETSAESTGLGLAICRGIVEAVGGTISYAPHEPRGARFQVRLPAVPPR